MFDLIAEKFYKRNFGSCSKADFELLMFHFFLEKINAGARDEKDMLDFNECSDYIISQKLGITQERVRSLKVKKQLVYPYKYDWKNAFAQLVEHARYDEKKREIVINIPDPNLFYDIQNFVESNGGYIDIQLNKKVLKIKVEYYIQLAMYAENESNKKKIIKEIKKIIEKHKKEEFLLDEKRVGETLTKMPEILFSIVKNILEIVQHKNILLEALNTLLQR